MDAGAVMELRNTTVDDRAISVSNLVEAAVAVRLWITSSHGPVISLFRAVTASRSDVRRISVDVARAFRIGTPRLRPSSCARTPRVRTLPTARRRRV